jgi:DNA repair protein RadC
MKDAPHLSDLSLPLFVAPQPDTPVQVMSDTKGGRAVPSYLRDHRKRLRDRFLSGGANAMPDYELLEMLLFGAIPRGDVKPLARRLIERFGDLASVLAAPPPQLRRIDGVGIQVVAALKLAEAVAARTARAKVLNRPVISSWDALLDYVHTAMAHREVEHVRVLFLDRKNCLIDDAELGRGTVDHVPVYPREIMRMALDVNASALILVHNHPSGDPAPSEADLVMTERLRLAAEALGLVLHDHLIVGRSQEFSFRAAGHL